MSVIVAGLPRLGYFFAPPESKRKRYVQLIASGWDDLPADKAGCTAQSTALRIIGTGLVINDVCVVKRQNALLDIIFPKRYVKANDMWEPILRYATVGDEGAFAHAVVEAATLTEVPESGEKRAVNLVVSNLTSVNSGKDKAYKKKGGMIIADYLLVGLGLVLTGCPIFLGEDGEPEAFNLPYCTKTRRNLATFFSGHKDARGNFQLAASQALNQYLQSQGAKLADFLPVESCQTNSELDTIKKANPLGKKSPAKKPMTMAQKLKQKEPQVMGLLDDAGTQQQPTL